MTMTEMKSQIQEAYHMVDQRQNEAALKLIDEILAHLQAPDRIGDIPPARLTIYDWLWKAKRGLSGEPELVPPKAALRSALALVH
jgi:hypothetical protein